MAEENKTRTKEELEDIEFNYFKFFAIDLKENDSGKIRSRINSACNTFSTSLDPRAVRIAKELKSDALAVMTDPAKREKEAQNYLRLKKKEISRSLSLLGQTIHKSDVESIAKKQKVPFEEVEEMVYALCNSKGRQYIDDTGKKTIVSFDFKEYERVETFIKALADEKIKDLYDLLGLSREADLSSIRATLERKKIEDAPKWASRGGIGENLKQLYGCADKIFKEEGDKGGMGRRQYLRFLAIKDEVYFPLKQLSRAGVRSVHLPEYVEYVKLISEKGKVSAYEAYNEMAAIVDHLKMEANFSYGDIQPFIKNKESGTKPSPSFTDKDKEAFDKGVKAYRGGDYEKALSFFKNVPSDYPDLATYADECRRAIIRIRRKERQKKKNYEEGVDFYKQGQYEEAKASFEKADDYLDAKGWVDKCQEKIDEASSSSYSGSSSTDCDCGFVLEIIINISFIIPAILSIIFLIIVIINHQRISAISDLAPWLAGSIIATVVTVIAAIVLIHIDNEEWFGEPPQWIAGLIVLAVSIGEGVFGFTQVGKLFSHNPADNLSISLVSGEISTEENKMAFSFEISNSNSYSVDYIHGYIICSLDEVILMDHDFDWRYSVEGGSSYSFQDEFRYSSTQSVESGDFSSLSITLKVDRLWAGGSTYNIYVEETYVLQ